MDKVKQFLIEAGRKGGNQTKKRGKAYYSRIGKMGAEARRIIRDNLCRCCEKPALPEDTVCKECL